MKNIYVIVLSITVFSSCNLFNSNEYAITGKVIDQFNQGVDSVKIYHSDQKFVYTNNTGVFSIPALKDEQVLIPEKENYTFTPGQITISVETDTLVFNAHRTITENEVKMLNWMNALQLNNGLLESTDKGNIVSLYDNALSALVFMSYNDFTRAEKVFDFFHDRIYGELLNGKGGYSQFRDRNGTPNNHKWLGDNAWLLIALNNYQKLSGKTTYAQMASELEKWIRALQDEDGGIWGGYTSDGVRIHKVTEGNIDAFNAIPGFDDFHSNLLTFFETARWDSTAKSLVAWPGNARYLYALDVHAWSYCAFENFPVYTLTFAEQFVTSVLATTANHQVTGFCFDMDNDVVWLEGTGEMVVAFNEAGFSNEANFYLKELEKMMVESKYTPGAFGLPYASNAGTGYGGDQLWSGAEKNPAISSTAWYLFGMNHFNPFKVEKQKNIPDEKQFWNKK